ncbi:hypothetical protein ACQKFO_08490 [Rossellomorea sp. NPDC071047]|uniref:hypothetical protein n=1 Tax=Rossellomorea sp. NPDC071047 TaxID=3390675 RepID=UPI003D0797AA
MTATILEERKSLVGKVKVRYLRYDDIHDRHYYSDTIGRRLNDGFVITDIEFGYGIERIFEERDGYCFVRDGDDFTPIIVDIDNAGDIDFSHEAVKKFFEYLIETTLQSK